MPNSGQGNATLTGVGTTIVKARGLGNVPILVTKNPTSITQTVTGGGAMSFGISITVAEIIKVVTNRFDPSDQFRLDIIGPNSATTVTSGTNTGVQPQGLQVISGVPGFFRFDESMASGSLNPLSMYNATVQLSNLTGGGTTLPNTIALGSGVTLTTGDYAVMTITNSPASTVVTLNKSVDKKFSGVNETLKYTLVVKNSSPYTVNNVVLTDTIPTNTTFVPNSIFVDGVANSGTVAPPNGLFLGTLPSNTTQTITFDVLVQGTIPSPNTAVNNANVNFTPKINIGSVNSQTVVTTISGVVIESTKANNKAFANIGDTITYNIVIRNTGNATASNIVFIDTIPNGTTLVSSSFKQDTTNISGSPNPPGVTLPNALGVNRTTTVTFQVKVDTIPDPNPIPNTAYQTFTYTVDPSIPNGKTSSQVTNTVTTQVNNANFGSILKLADKSFADCGEVITYTIIAPNTGNVTAQNVVFKDTIPNGTVFVANSVFVNGVGQSGVNPASGITVPNIAPGATATLTFSVKVQC